MLYLRVARELQSQGKFSGKVREFWKVEMLATLSLAGVILFRKFEKLESISKNVNVKTHMYGFFYILFLFYICLFQENFWTPLLNKVPFIREFSYFYSRMKLFSFYIVNHLLKFFIHTGSLIHFIVTEIFFFLFLQ